MRLIDRYFGKAVWILTGVCFAVACSMMLISGSFNLDRFYDVGDVYDGYRATYMPSGNYGIDYNAEDEILTVTSESAAKDIAVLEGNWRYIYIFFPDINRGSFDTTVSCYNGNETPNYQMQITLKEGTNLIEFPADIKYNWVSFVIANQQGLSFQMDKLQFRERAPVFSKSRFAKSVAFFFGGFLFTTGILFLCIKRKVVRWDWYGPVHGLQTIFLYIGKVSAWISSRCPEQKRGRIRSGIFCLLFLFMQALFVLNLNNSKTYPYLGVICASGIVGVALLCHEGTLKYLNWKNPLSASWFGLWILGIVSEFIVQKRFAYVGYHMIFAVGFLFFMWGNMKQRKVLLGDFIRGIKWSFIPNLLFCYLFRPYKPGYRYLGGAHEPGYFAMYLLFVGIAFLCEMDFNIKEKAILIKDVAYIFALGVCVNLIWRTQTMTAIVAMGATALIFSFKLWKRRKQVKIFGLAFYLFVFCAGYLINESCIYHIPRQVNAEIKFERDLYLDTVTEHPFTLTVRASVQQETIDRIFYKLKKVTSLETLTTGRTLYWKAYARQINLWGHKGNAVFMGASHKAHNGLLDIMHRYGIFAAVPYILMLLFNLWYAWRYFRRHLSENKYAYFVLAGMCCCNLILLVENLEMPFCWVYWYVLYIGMGVYFDDEKLTEYDKEKSI